jgi:hypothetical protein
MNEENLIGGYYMHHMGGSQRGTLVRIKERLESGCYGVEYVSVRSDGDVGCGGYSYAWPAIEFKPVTDPVLIAASHVYESRRLADEYRANAAKSDKDASVWLAAMVALRSVLSVALSQAKR